MRALPDSLAHCLSEVTGNWGKIARPGPWGAGRYRGGLSGAWVAMAALAAGLGGRPPSGFAAIGHKAVRPRCSGSSLAWPSSARRARPNTRSRHPCCLMSPHPPSGSLHLMDMMDLYRYLYPSIHIHIVFGYKYIHLLIQHIHLLMQHIHFWI